MGIDDKTETFGIILSDEGASGLIDEIREALQVGSKTVILMVTNNEDHKEKLKRLETGEISEDNIPEPDVLVVDTVYTLGLATSLESVVQTAKFWSGDTQGGMN